MQQQTKASKIMLWGAIPQLSMMVLYIWQQRSYAAFQELSNFSVWLWPSHLGLVIFAYCLYILYVRRARITGLITSGVFKYTRHPMYTGLFLMNLNLWLPKPVSNEPLFYIGQSLFLLCLIVAGWSQEKETLARFGKDAEEYYAKTPRLFILYPFVKK